MQKTIGINQHRTALFLPWKFWMLSPNLLLDPLQTCLTWFFLRAQGSKINIIRWYMGEWNTQVNRWCANKVFAKVPSCTKSSVYLFKSTRALLEKIKEEKVYNGKTMKTSFSKFFFYWYSSSVALSYTIWWQVGHLHCSYFQFVLL